MPPIVGYQSCISGAPGLGRCDQPVRSIELCAPPPPWSRIVHLVVFCMIISICITRTYPCKLTGMPVHDSPIDWLTNAAFVITIIGTGAPQITLEASLGIKVSMHLVQRTRTLGLTKSGRLFLPSGTRYPFIMRGPS